MPPQPNTPMPASPAFNTPPVPPFVAPPPRKKKWPFIVGGGVLILLALAGTLVFVFRSGMLVNISDTIPSDATTGTRYLGFQFMSADTTPSSFSKTKIAGMMDDLVRAIGEKGDTTRKLAVFVGPLGWEFTDDELRTIIRGSFALAEEKDVAVGFHIEDSMFWNKRQDIWSRKENVEWSNWQGTTVPHRIIGWVGNGAPILAPPMCYNAPAITAEAKRIAKDIIGVEIKKGVDRLEAVGKPHLFAGVIAGWETRMQDDSAMTGPQVFYGYCALTNLGYSAGNPPADIDLALQDVVKNWTILWTQSLHEAGISRDRIYTHNGVAKADLPANLPPHFTNPNRDLFKNADPSVVAFNDYSYPGFSHYAGAGDGFEQIYRLLEAKDNPPWGITEGTVVGLEDSYTGGVKSGEGLSAEEYLAGAFNRGAIFVNMFGWDDGGGESPFAKATMGAEALAAYKKFLEGGTLSEAPPGRAATAGSSAGSSSLSGKMSKVGNHAPAWIVAHHERSEEVTALLQELDRLIKANDAKQAEATADKILDIIE